MRIGILFFAATAYIVKSGLLQRHLSTATASSDVDDCIGDFFDRFNKCEQCDLKNDDPYDYEEESYPLKAIALIEPAKPIVAD